MTSLPEFSSEFRQFLRQSRLARWEPGSGAVALGDNESFQLVTTHDGWFVVERRSRGGSDGLRFRARRLGDVERYLTLERGDTLRVREFPNLVWTSVPPPVAPAAELVPVHGGWVSFRSSSEDGQIEMPYRGIAEIGAAHAFSHVLDASIDQLCDSFRAFDGAPVLAPFMRRAGRPSRSAAATVDRVVHGITVRVEASSELETSIDELFEALETVPMSGLRAGTSFRMGWMVYDLVDGDGVLQVVAPDLSTEPWSRRSSDLTLPLWVHLGQRHLLRRTDVRGEFPLYSDKVVLHDGALEADDVVLRRQQSSPQGDSGWFLGIVGRDAEPHDLRAVWVWELLRRRRSLLQAMALPGSWTAGFEGETLDAVIDASGALVWQSDEVPAEPVEAVLSPSDDGVPSGVLAALLHEEVFEIRVRRLDDLAAWYAWTTERGGDAVILADDGTWLRAPSTVPPERHRADFAIGRRSQVG